MCVRVCVSMCICVCKRMRMCVCVCVYVHVCMFRHVIAIHYYATFTYLLMLYVLIECFDFKSI